MKNAIKIAFGITAALVCAGEVYSIWKVHQAIGDIKKFNDAVDDISSDIEVDIPDKIVSVAVERAADREASNAAKQVAANANTIIQNSVDKVINEQKDNIKSSVQEELERKISLVDIEDIKSRVVNKASAAVIDNVTQRIPFINSTSSDDASSIIRACNEAGITDSWDIKDILRAAKGVNR